MKRMDLLEVLNEHDSDYAFAATYDFDPLFFEHRILRTTAFARAKRIAVFVDAGVYARLAAQERPAQDVNRRYLLAPIRSTQGVFHPKVVLLCGRGRAILIVGSANLTASGIAHNLELCHLFALNLPTNNGSANDRVASATIRTAFRLFLHWTNSCPASVGNLLRKTFDDMVANHAWIAESAPVIPGAPMLLHSTEGNLWSQITRLLERARVRRVFVLSPFYDPDTRLFSRTKVQWPEASLEVAAQQGSSNLPVAAVATWASKRRRKVRILELHSKRGRRLHAKALAFVTPQRTFWLAGSPNFTAAALDGRNVEVALWFTTDESPEAMLFDSEVAIRPADLEHFEPGYESEPKPGSHLGSGGPVLSGAVLADGFAVELDYSVPANLAFDKVFLRIRNAGDTVPVLSAQVAVQTAGQGKVKMTEDQVDEIRRAALCELVFHRRGHTIAVSNSVWLVHLPELRRADVVRDSTEARLSRITETGEGLVEQLADLARTGRWGEMAELLNAVNIRFDDGSPARRGIGVVWGSPRDPYTGDEVPVEFLVPTDERERLRLAIKDFVHRHQAHRLRRHVRRGNLNGLRNFLDIFRALNQLLVEYHAHGIVPNFDVIDGITDNILLFVGKRSSHDENADGFIDSVVANLEGEEELIRERFAEEGVPAILIAALREAQQIRAQQDGRLASWPQYLPSYRGHIADGLNRLGLPWPGRAEVSTAAQIYRVRTKETNAAAM